MAFVRKHHSGAWQVRYRDPAGRERAKSFERKTDAQRFANTVETDKSRGDWLDPRLGRVTFGEWAEDWLAQLAHIKPKTRLDYESTLRRHVLPPLAGAPIVNLDRVALRRFVADLVQTGAGASTVRIALHVARSVLELAVDAGALKGNPAVGVKLPRGEKTDKLFLTPDQIEDLAHIIKAPSGVLVRFAAYSGLRAGEIGALRMGRLDLPNLTVEVAESLADVAGHLHFGQTKTYARRHVVLPDFICDELADFLNGRSGNRDELVFTAPHGGPIRHGNFYRQRFKPAVVRSELPDSLRFHDLRHTYAALCISSTADPYAVMKRMGHSTISVTYDTYGHLFPHRDREITEALERLGHAARVKRAQEATSRGPEVADDADPERTRGGPDNDETPRPEGSASL
jgi:integrase